MVIGQVQPPARSPLGNQWQPTGKEVELTGVEPVSEMGTGGSLLHRLSLSDPQGGDRRLAPGDGRSPPKLRLSLDGAGEESCTRWGCDPPT